MLGYPVFYMPFFSHPDPSERRASGFLTPSFGNSSHIGTFFDMPYFWAIDAQRDLTIHPLITTGFGPQLSGEYRQKFNDGVIRIDAGGAYDQGAQGYVFATGRFSYDDTYRYGFDINRTSSVDYLRDFKVQNYASVLSSNAFIEGFGVGAYTKLSVNAFQGAATTIDQSKLPYVLPRYEYSFFGEPDSLGRAAAGRLHQLQRGPRRGQQHAARRGQPGVGPVRSPGMVGELYKLILHTDAAVYTSSDLNQQPTYGNASSTETARAQPTVGVEFRWPFARAGGATGNQTVEPIVQLLGGPNTGRFLRSKHPQRGQPRPRLHRRQPVLDQQIPRHRPGRGRHAGQCRRAWHLDPSAPC